jgi:hypothetical protein
LIFTWAEEKYMSKPKGRGPSGPSRSTCDDLTFDSILSGLEPAAVASLSVGTRLTVRQQIENATRLAFCYLNDQRIGTLSGPELAQLFECLAANRRFQAIVLSIEDGLVRVRVEPSA